MLQRIQSWVSVVAGVCVCLSGIAVSALVFSEEIDVYQNGGLWHVVPQSGDIRLDEATARIKAVFPDHTILFVRLPSSRNHSIEYWLQKESLRRVYVDPWRLNILGSRGDYVGLQLFSRKIDQAVNSFLGKADFSKLPDTESDTAQAWKRLSELLKLAEFAAPGAHATWMRFPDMSSTALMIRFQYPNDLNPAGNTYVALNAVTGEILLRDDTAINRNKLQHSPDYQFPVHMNVALGLPSRIAIVILGLIPTSFFLSNACIGLYRRNNNKLKWNVSLPDASDCKQMMRPFSIKMTGK